MTTTTIANDQYSTLFTTECQHTFHITPYPWLVAVGRTLLQASVEKHAVRYLCVRPTGGGKSLVFNTVSAAIKGVTICICPLLSLGADQYHLCSLRHLFHSHPSHELDTMQCDKMQFDAIRCHAIRCNVIRCNVMQ